MELSSHLGESCTWTWELGIFYIDSNWQQLSLLKNATIHLVTTMLATSTNVLFPSHDHVLTTGTDDPTLWLSIIKVKGHQYQWLAAGYDLEIGYV